MSLKQWTATLTPGESPPKTNRLVSRVDLERALTMAFLLPPAWVSPARVRRSVARGLALATGSLLPARRASEEQRLPSFLVNLMGVSRPEATTRFIAAWNEKLMAALRDLRPDRWR